MVKTFFVIYFSDGEKWEFNFLIYHWKCFKKYYFVYSGKNGKLIESNKIYVANKPYDFNKLSS